MASSLIYNRRLVWEFTQGIALTILLLIGLTIFGGAVVFKVFGSIGLAVYIVLLFGPFLQQRVSQERKKLRLRADGEASSIYGSGPFLAVLMKIDSLGLKDIETVKIRRIMRNFATRPSISERIQNLRKTETPKLRLSIGS